MKAGAWLPETGLHTKISFSDAINADTMVYESLPKKILRCIMPLVIHLIICFAAFFAAAGIFMLAGYPYSNDMLYRYSMIIMSAAGIITIIALRSYFKKDAPVQSDLALKNIRTLLLIILLGIALSHGLNLLISLFNTGTLAESYAEAETALYSDSIWMVIIRTVIIAPIMEELLFRGLMFRRIKEYTGFIAGALISSAVFAVYHLNLIQGIYAFIMGFVFCLIYNRFDHILVPIIMHAAANIFSVIIYYINLSYSVPAYYSILAISIILSGLIIFYLLRRA